jgi:ATP synthase protein I
MPRPMASPSPDNTGNGWSGMGVGFTIASTLLAGMLVWGGLGYLLDSLIWSGKVFTGLGIVLGAAGGGYIVYLRYGRSEK